MVKEWLGNRVRELRCEKGLTQEDLALSIGMDRSYLASVELGKRNISLENIQKLSMGLGVTMEELFKGA